MDVFALKIAGKNIFTYYNHYVMEKNSSNSPIKSDLVPIFKEISLDNIDVLKELDGFSIEYIKKLLKKYDSKVFGIGALVNNVIAGILFFLTAKQTFFSSPFPV